MPDVYGLEVFQTITFGICFPKKVSAEAIFWVIMFYIIIYVKHCVFVIDRIFINVLLEASGMPRPKPKNVVFINPESRKKFVLNFFGGSGS
jgi:hypothetical protein